MRKRVRRLLNGSSTARSKSKDTGSPLAGRALACKPVPLRGQTACGLKPPLHPFAGSEWGIRIACDPPTQQSSHAGDDGGKFTVALKTTVSLAQAHYRHPGESRDPVSLFAYHRLESPTDQLPISDADQRQDIRTRITRSCTQCVFNSQQLNPLRHALQYEFIDF